MSNLTNESSIRVILSIIESYQRLLNSGRDRNHLVLSRFEISNLEFRINRLEFAISILEGY